MYSISTLRKRAYKVNHKISKGFQHYLYNNTVVRDCNGDAYTGYNLEDLSRGFLVWGCYDNICDHLWTLEDIEEYLKGIYEENGLKW